MTLITAAGLCLAITLAAKSDAPLSKSRVKIACEHSQDLIDAAEAYAIDPFVLAGLVWVESRWTPAAISRSNACGLTQVLPKYAYENCTQLLVPRRSLFAGARALRKWFHYQAKHKKGTKSAAKGGMSAALACYYAGNWCDNTKSGRRYSRKVMKIANRVRQWYSKNLGM
tara:strand:+ start:610 stop:1119 length:510 start_codon:yes stop_codon:yes gene_type:complete